MNCIKCGNKLDDNASFCDICGSIVKKEENINESIKKPKGYTIIGIIIVILTVILLITLIYLTIYGFKKQTKDIIYGSSTTEETTTNNLILGNANLFYIADNIDLNITYETLVGMVGYDGKITSNDVYSFNGSSGEVMNVTFNESGINLIEIEYTIDMLKNKNTDLVNAETMKNKIEQGLTISELLSTFGENGYVIKRDTSTKTYSWVNINGYEITAVVDTLGNVIEINI